MDFEEKIKQTEKNIKLALKDCDIDKASENLTRLMKLHDWDKATLCKYLATAFMFNSTPQDKAEKVCLEYAEAMV